MAVVAVVAVVLLLELVAMGLLAKSGYSVGKSQITTPVIRRKA